MTETGKAETRRSRPGEPLRLPAMTHGSKTILSILERVC